MGFDTDVADVPWMVGAEAAPALEWAAQRLEDAGIETPRLEAQLLLALALRTSRTAVVAGLHPYLDTAERERFRELVEARLHRVPLAYLRGDQEFYGLPFRVSRATLIPRPETELLVDFARAVLGKSEQPSTLVDVGTGTGCIAIAALSTLPYVRGIALDLSADALALARYNAEANGVGDRIRLVQGSLLEGIRGAVDLIVSNPPYIPTQEVAHLQPEVRDYEPRLALDGGEAGMQQLQGLAQNAGRVLKPGGWIAVECGLGQAREVAALFEQCGLNQVEIAQDLAHIERMVSGRNV